MEPSQMSDEQLTQAVAEEVMEWTSCDLTIGDFYSGIVSIAPGWKDKTGAMQISDWQPALRPEHWMMVIERMEELGWIWEISTDAIEYGCEEKKYAVMFVNYELERNVNELERHAVECSDIIGRAVLAAALAAKRQSLEGGGQSE